MVFCSRYSPFDITARSIGMERRMGEAGSKALPCNEGRMSMNGRVKIPRMNDGGLPLAHVCELRR
jgi:hypothetical protein